MKTTIKSKTELQGEPQVRSSEWLGELWTDNELWDARHVMSCVYEGVPCLLGIERMRELEKRGLVTDIYAKPGRGRYANRYEFMWTDKLEELVKAVRTSSPNIVLGRDAAKPKSVNPIE